jgi:hypothetical protein
MGGTYKMARILSLRMYDDQHRGYTVNLVSIEKSQTYLSIWS